MKLSLRNRFLLPTLGLIVLGMSLAATISYFKAQDALRKAIDSQITQLSDSAVKVLSSWCKDRRRDIEYWSSDSTYVAAVAGSSASQFARRAADGRLAELKKTFHYFEDINVANPKGDIVCSSSPDVPGNINVAERGYFQESMKGHVAVSEPVMSKKSGNPVFVIAVPVKEGEQVAGVFLGVVDIGFFNEQFIDSVKLGQGGYAYVMDKNGLVIAHPDRSMILKENMGSNDWGREMLSKGDGLLTYTWQGVEKLAAYKRSEELGWTVVVTAPTAEVFAPIKSLGYVNLAVAGIITFLAAVVILLLVRSTVNPINRVIEALGRASEQVASGATQVASSSQQLADGSTQQAAALEESSSSLEEMTSMTRQNASNASQANTLMKEANRVVARANESMRELTSSMGEISQASEQTSKIIKTIDEIAFQTNLLALNAAVEAARAGEAGAGFAVVADEVRNLAMRAADAARSTATLIDGTVKKIQAGSQLVMRTNEAFSEVAGTSSKVDELVGEIAAASNEQAQGIDQVNRAVAEMDKVTQQAAAIAEESSGAAEEMKAQAKEMMQCVAQLVEIVGAQNHRAARGKTAGDPSSNGAGERGASAPKLPVYAHKGKGMAVRRPKRLDPEKAIPLEEDFDKF